MVRDRRRQIIDYSIIGIVLLVIVVLFWPSFGGDGEATPAPDGVAEEASTPTPEAEPDETPAPEPTAEPTTELDEFTALCVPGDATQVLANFVQRFNDGDMAALARMLPATAAETPRTSSTSEMDQHVLHSFKVHESGTINRPEEVIDFLSERHEAGEFWRLKEYRLSRMYRNPNLGNPELDEATAVIQRSSEEFHTHEMQGSAVINCVEGKVILWNFSTDDAELAVPIQVDEFLSAVGPYRTAEMRELRMIVSTDLRPDGGSLSEWDIRRDEANSPSGLYVERVTVDDLSGGRLVTYVFDGQGWYMDQRGWEVTGDLTGPTVLPLEVMLTRREPTITAELIRVHRDEIPEEGTFIISKDYVIPPELREAFSRVDGAGDVEGLIEIEIQDGALVRTRYRLIGESGLHFTAPEIRWIEIVRADRFDANRFFLPSGHMSVGRQFEVPDTLGDRMTFESATEHVERISEVFTLRWDDVQLTVTVMPSRGGATGETVGTDWDPAWWPQIVEHDEFLIAVATSGDDSMLTSAVWDTGSYRFEISTDPDAEVEPGWWNVEKLREIVEVLRPASDDGED